MYITYKFSAVMFWNKNKIQIISIEIKIIPLIALLKFNSIPDDMNANVGVADIIETQL